MNYISGCFQFEVFWRKENNLLPQELNQFDGVLTIKNIQFNDSGIYVCETNSYADPQRRISILVRGTFTPSRKLFW